MCLGDSTYFSMNMRPSPKAALASLLALSNESSRNSSAYHTMVANALQFDVLNLAPALANIDCFAHT